MRPAVIRRQKCQGNRCGNGANTKAIFSSVYRILKLGDLDPLDTIVAALKTYVVTSSLPPLPLGKAFGWLKLYENNYGKKSVLDSPEIDSIIGLLLMAQD